MIDKRIESTMNELINAEIWSTNLYLSLQVYFESEQLPILSSWLNTQAGYIIMEDALQLMR